jgi:hypothetical protein
MADTYHLLDPCLPPTAADAVVDRITARGSYPMYVEAPIREGFGAGLVRRHDAFLHYVQQKAARGETESFRDTAARTNLFRGVFAEGRNVHDPELADLLYDHGPFLQAARDLTGRDLVVPDMLYANLLLPGQELALHTDTPEYRGMSKATTPEWLLVAMHHAGLFEDWRVRIAGGVTFFHPPASGGAFVLYPDGPTGPRLRLGVRHNTSVLLDADALFHGVERVGGPDAPSPDVLPGQAIHWAGDGTWEVRDGERVVGRYAWGALRLSLQWKALCFADAAERAAYEDGTDDLDLDRVLETLLADLRSRGVLGAARPDDTELAITLMRTYIPFPEA